MPLGKPQRAPASSDDAQASGEGATKRGLGRAVRASVEEQTQQHASDAQEGQDVDSAQQQPPPPPPAAAAAPRAPSYMERKLKRLESEALDSFRGDMTAKPHRSRLERELEAAKQSATWAPEATAAPAAPAMSQRFTAAALVAANAAPLGADFKQPRVSRVEREREHFAEEPAARPRQLPAPQQQQQQSSLGEVLRPHVSRLERERAAAMAENAPRASRPPARPRDQPQSLSELLKPTEAPAPPPRVVAEPQETENRSKRSQAAPCRSPLCANAKPRLSRLEREKLEAAAAPPPPAASSRVQGTATGPTEPLQLCAPRPSRLERALQADRERESARVESALQKMAARTPSRPLRPPPEMATQIDSAAVRQAIRLFG